jgi:hypothetical protein
MRLPRALRQARALAAPSADPHGFNRGFFTPSQVDLPDALRGSARLVGDQGAAIARLEQAARNSPRRRG